MYMIAGKFFLVLSLLGLLLTSACKKDDEKIIDNSPQLNYLTLSKGDTAKVVFPELMAADASGRNAGVGYQLTNDSTGTTLVLAGMLVSGTDSNLVVIRKRMPKSLVGTYDLNFNPVFISQGDATNTFYGSVAQFFETLTITDPLVLITYAGTGKLQITQYDASSKRIWGTFNFTSKVGKLAKVTITQGKFNGIPQVN